MSAGLHFVTKLIEFSSPLIETRDVKSVAVVVFGSDDGLCGAFNINIFDILIDALFCVVEVYPNLFHFALKLLLELLVNIRFKYLPKNLDTLFCRGCNHSHKIALRNHCDFFELTAIHAHYLLDFGVSLIFFC